MEIVAIALLLLLVLAVAIVWLSQTTDETKGFGSALVRTAHTLFALLAVITLPAALLLPLPPELPRWLVALASLAVWGVFVVSYWDRRVIPQAVVEQVLHPAPGGGLALGGSRTPAPAVPAANPDGDVEREYHWVFQASDGLPVPMRFSVFLSMARYQELRAEPRRPVYDWAHYASHDVPELETIAAELYRLHAGRRWSSLEQARNVLAFTQLCIPYRLDADTTPAAEWPRYPLETLMDGVGDCEDDVILAAAILKRLGFEVALLYYPGHVALGVAGADGLPGEFAVDARTGHKYFYGETTAEGWHLGEAPPAFRGQAPEKVEVVFHPLDADDGGH